MCGRVEISRKTRSPSCTPHAVHGIMAATDTAGCVGNAMQDWMKKSPYVPDDPNFKAKYHASCYCGRVEFEACADPVDAKLCHCRGCQKLHGAPMQWAVIFHKHHIRFTRGVELLYLYNSEEDLAEHILPCKISCSVCRSPIADEGRNMFLAFGSLFDFKSKPLRDANDSCLDIPASFKPSCHIFFGSHVVDMRDDAPKFRGHKQKL